MRFEQMMNSQGRYYRTSSATVHLALNGDGLSLKVLRRGQAILGRSKTQKFWLQKFSSPWTYKYISKALKNRYMSRTNFFKILKKILYDLSGGLKIPDKEVKYVPVQTVMLPSIITTEH